MLNRIIICLKNFDWVLFTAVILLVSFGLLEIYSVALGQDDLSLLNFKKQILFIAIGILMLFLFSFIDYHNLKSHSNYIYIIGLVLLVGVLIFGSVIRGTKGWFQIAGFSLQPVELVKIIMLIFLAKYFSGITIKINPLKHLVYSGIGVIIFIILVLRQPDLGSALLLFFVWVSMILLAGFKKKYIAVIGLIFIIATASGWVFFFKDYQKERILTFLNPSTNSLEEGYNIKQAIIAVGSGRFMGRGLGFGSQTQLKFLPEAQNDFIFAVISEELGFLGASIVIILFAVVFFRLLSSLKKINNDFGVFFILGTVALIFIEMFINIAMNIGLLPVIGISLPFLSYGGSAIISTLIIMGIAQSIIIRSKLKY